MSVSRLAQTVLFALGAFTATWAFTDPRFAASGSFVHGGVSLPLAAAAALLSAALTFNGRFRNAGLWGALALMGQAAALQLVEAGLSVRYQHYVRPLGRLLTDVHPLFPALVALQAAAVATGLYRKRSAIRRGLGGVLGGWRTAGVIFALFLSSAALSRYPSVYLSELAFATAVELVSLGNVALAVWALPRETLLSFREMVDAFLAADAGDEERSGDGAPCRVDAFSLAAALWVTVAAAVLCVFSYEMIPHIPDEGAYLYHARYFAEGMLTAPAPPVMEAFDIELMDFGGGRWWSAQLPGWPAMLSVGVLLGAPWLVNPVLAGVNIVLAYLLITEVYGRGISRMVVLLLCLSPWYVFMAMNFMPHTFTLTCFLAAALGVALARRTGAARWAFAGGLGLGVISLIRPLEAVAAALVLGLWALGAGGRRLRAASIAALAIGTASVGSLGLYYNMLLTGNPLRFPFMNYTDRFFGPGTNTLGFGPEKGFGWTTIDPFPGHGAVDVGVNAMLNIFTINTDLFGWGAGSLLFLFLFLFAGRKARSDYLMMAVVAAVIALHSFYWFSGGPDFGARYWYLVIVPLAALSARGIYLLLQDAPWGAGAAAAALIMSLITLVNFFPWRAIDKYFHFRSIVPGVERLAEDNGFGRDLVLVRGNRYVDYASAAVYLPADFEDGSPVYAWDRDPEVRKRLLLSFPDRDVWIVNGPTITGGGFELAGGPYAASYLLSQG